jgi:hypothetical protein
LIKKSLFNHREVETALANSSTLTSFFLFSKLFSRDDPKPYTKQHPAKSEHKKIMNHPRRPKKNHFKELYSSLKPGTPWRFSALTEEKAWRVPSLVSTWIAYVPLAV